VQETITHVTHLEQVLFAKLESLSKCCLFHKNPPTPHPCAQSHSSEECLPDRPCTIDCRDINGSLF
ncbi:MAG: hypothetical protein RRY35_06035, partial [Clostridiales bacterium]